MSAYHCGGDANKGSEADQATGIVRGIAQDGTYT